MKILKTTFLILGLLAILYSPMTVQALGLNLYERSRIGENVNADVNIDVKAEMLGVKEKAVNESTSEATETVTGNGMLIEIGNTTAKNTTIIIRTTSASGITEDRMFGIDNNTKIVTNSGAKASLSDWIAGDPITFTARHFINSDTLTATRLVNTSFKPQHKGINGWITMINNDTNKIDVLWNNNVYTISLLNTKIVVGNKNPANVTDLRINDRIRARVSNDRDNNQLTWDASILVVLRRDNNLFMRVTRWTVPATITKIPKELATPMSIEVSINNSKSFEKNDVNNLIGEPGTKLIIDITSDTMLVRKHYGKALLSELSEGDAIRVIGKRDEITGHLIARVIIDDSVQRLGVARRLGSITAIDNSPKTLTIVLFKTENPEKTWQINTNNSTVIYKNGKIMSWSDITIGDVVRISGAANNIQKIVTANTIVIISEFY